ncbi:MAG: 16S rRNA (cytidine(1402)-2'-O)-methyltransferase, partial [bacterium]
MSGKLFLIPTPIGNLEDITLRALRMLKEVDLVLAEDTRTAGQLLRHFEIDKRLLSHHQHNEHQALKEIIKMLKDGTNIGLVSDAGTPAISDPGFLLVRECIKEDIEVET